MTSFSAWLTAGLLLTTAAPAPRPRPLAFASACQPGERITLAFVGDVLLHPPLERQGQRSPIRFTELWEQVDPFFAWADVGCANLEGPIAPRVDQAGRDLRQPNRRPPPTRWLSASMPASQPTSLTSSAPNFNFPPGLLADLQRSGIDVVSTANNHSLDRGRLGIDRTLEYLDACGLRYTGTRRAGASDAPWFALVERQGFRIAFLACTFWTNLRRDDGDQVLECQGDRRPDLLDQVTALAARPDVDAVIVLPHWGKEYAIEPMPVQRRFAANAVRAGASAVIGNHPHVLQGWQKVAAPDGREALVAYSLGNFISDMRPVENRTSIILFLTLMRPGPGQRALVAAARALPIFTARDGNNVQLMPLDLAAVPAAGRRVRALFDSADLVESTGQEDVRNSCGTIPASAGVKRQQ